MAVIHFTHGGTIWRVDDDRKLATRHDGATIARHTDGFYVATTADGVGICDTKHWPADRSTILDGRMLRAVDNCCPPSERQFHCGACNARFSRPPETLVLMFVDLYSNVIPACSETCGQQLLARGTQRT